MTSTLLELSWDLPAQPPRTPLRERFPVHAWTELADRVSWVVLGLAAFLIGSHNILGGPGIQDDEGTYTAQALAVQQGSLAPYTYWYDHPPLGWMQLAVGGAVTRALGLGAGSELGAMRYVSAFNFAMCCVLIFIVARRLGVRLALAIGGALVFMLSPLALTIGRQVYLDTVAAPWILVAFALVLSPPRRLGQHAVAGLAFAIAVLTKITVAIFGPALLLALLDRTGVRAPKFPVVGFLTAGGLTLTFFPLMALLRGELISGPGHVSLQDALSYQFVSRAGSGWIWQEGSARMTLLQDWLTRDPFILVVGAAAALVCLTSVATRWLFAALAFFAAPVVLSQGYLPAMYIYVGLPLLALATAVAADRMLTRIQALVPALSRMSRKATAGVAAAVIVVGVALGLPVSNVLSQYNALMVTDTNADWRATVQWTEANVPRDQVVLVPYSVWPDLHAAGFTDPWGLIAMEKADLDSEFLEEHPGGWREIQWVVEGPAVRSNIESLRLTNAKAALDNSTVVQTFGGWRIRRVLTGP